MECEAGRLHQNSEHCRVDFLPWLPRHGGPRRGRMLVTVFHNPWFVVLRFDIGDVARLDDRGPCPCGRNQGLTLAAIEGRVADVTFEPRGKAVTVDDLDGVLAEVPGLDGWQLDLPRPGEMQLRILAGPGSRAGPAASARNGSRSMYGERAQDRGHGRQGPAATKLGQNPLRPDRVSRGPAGCGGARDEDGSRRYFPHRRRPGSRRRGRDPLLAGILSRIGLERPGVAYIGAASNDNRVFFMWITALLKKAGAGTVRLAALASRRADPAKARALLQEADLVFVSGGDVELGMSVLEQTGTAALLRELYQAGKPFIGLSAGSIMLARSWVRWTDPERRRHGRRHFPAWAWPRCFAIPMPKKKIGRNSRRSCSFRPGRRATASPPAPRCGSAPTARWRPWAGRRSAWS